MTTAIHTRRSAATVTRNKNAHPPLVGDAKAFIPNPKADYHLAVMAERPGFVHHRYVDELLRYRANQEAARVALAADPKARVQVPMPQQLVDAHRADVRVKLERYDELSALEPVDRESLELEFNERALVDPSAALVWGHQHYVGAIVAQENLRRERLRLAGDLGHALPGPIPPTLKPGDPLRHFQIANLPNLIDLLREALATAPSPATKGTKR